MAMALDRSTEAIAARTDPAKRHLDDAARKRLRLLHARLHRRSAPSIVAAVEALRRLVDLSGRDARWQDGEHAGVAPDPDPERARLRPEPRFVGLPHHGAGRELAAHEGAAAAAELPDRDPVVHHPRRPDADRIPDQRPAPGGDDLPDAGVDRRHGRVGARDGHALAGARRDRARGRDRRRARRLRRRRARRSPRSCGRSTTCCRRCRSSSTSSRSSI